MSVVDDALTEASKKRSRFARVILWFKDKFAALRPGPRAWKGAALGATFAGVLIMASLASVAHSGLGKVADTFIGVLIGVVGIGLLGLLIAGLTALVRVVPKLVIGAVAGASLTIVVLPTLLDGPIPPLLALAPVVTLEALFGLSLGAVLGGELAGARRLKKIAMCGLLLLTSAANLTLVGWLAASGSDAHLIELAAANTRGVSPLSPRNPAEPGAWVVKAVTYGSGTDKHRAEFGRSVGLQTSPVDASLLLPDLKGVKAALRRWYWGFDEKQFPINGRVWFPDGDGLFPLVLIVHGNHTMEEFSDTGYAYLGELLASQGFITVSVDENFLNGSWSGDLRGKEMPARGWMLLQHLKVWRSWNEQTGNPFYHKVDLNNIALIGHSRGGEAVEVAAVFNHLSCYPEDANLKFDFNFAIKSLVAIAPSDEFYKPAGQPVVLENLDYFVLHGGHDADVSVFVGSRQYQRMKFTDASYHFKSTLYIYRANHGQFNTVWGINDWGEPFGPLLNYKPLLTGTEQRQIAKVYIAAFLGATLHGERAYVPFFRDRRAASAWLPPAVYLSRFRDSQFKVVSDYEEDIDLSTTTVPGGSGSGEHLKVWREEKLRLRAKGESDQANNVVRLGWEKANAGSAPAEYRLTLPDGLAQQWRLNPETKLCFALANASEKQEPVEVTVELASADGVKGSLPLSRFGQLSPPLTIRFSKLKPLESLLLKPTELVPQTFELPLADFVSAAPGFDTTKLKTITFLLDNSHDGAIILDDVGFSL